jgi:hypothetical protein
MALAPVPSDDPLRAGGARLAAGVLRTLIGHPFDTIKVLQQTGAPILGLRDLYRGAHVPLATGAVVSAGIVTCHSAMADALERFQGPQGPQESQERRAWTHALAGLLTGLLTGAVIWPIDAAKVRAQAGATAAVARGMRGIAVAREGLAGACFFGVNQALCGAGWAPAAAAAAAGVCSTVASHPLDVVRTRLSCGLSARAAGTIAASCSSGLPLALAKAAVTNAAQYALLSAVMRGPGDRDRGKQSGAPVLAPRTAVRSRAPS